MTKATFMKSALLSAVLFMPCISVFSKNPSSVTFLKNKGQWQKEILYQGTSTSPNVYLLTNGISFAQVGEEVENPDGSEDYPFLVWNMKFLNPDAGLKITGSGERESVISYLSGNDPQKWVIHPEEYTSITYESVFENIDLEFYGDGNNLKCDYIVRSGGKINSIKAYYEGIKHLSVNAEGALEVATLWDVQRQQTPVAWQVIGGKKQEVKINYRLLNDTTFGFEAMQGYDKNYDLVIDPLFEMVWSSYTKATGSSNNINYCFGNAMDKDGNVYLTGMVDGTFPITPGAYSGPGAVVPEIFVAKFSSDGTTMLYSTYLPANSSEHGVAIAVDDSGRAYVTGNIDLNFTGITNYPTTANAFQQVNNAGPEAFLTVLKSTGDSLLYSSFLGGSGGETGYGIALGPPRIAYITGSTTVGTFPTKATNVFPTGDKDVFVAKFDISQSGNNSLVYSTHFGGGQFSYAQGRSIAVNSAGNAFITGTIGTGNTSTTYPLSPGAYATVYDPGQDNIMGIVTKLSATTPVTLEYSTYLAPGYANSIAVDDVTGDAFIAGTTNTFAFPVTAGVVQPLHGGTFATDAYALRLNATGSALVYSTFLGGPFADLGTGIALNSAGEVYVTGMSRDSFPTSAGAIQTDNAGSMDFFAVHLNASATAYGCGGATYIGGSDEDYSGSFYDYPSPRISLRDHGGNNDTICISSTSHSQDFPTTPGVYGPVKVNSIADQPVFFKLTCVNSAVFPAAAFIAPDSICPGTCIDFTNLSQNAFSYLWTFQGASVSSSTDVNPSGICYANPGSYEVSLIAGNANGTDTVTSFVNVYPQPAPQGILQNGDTLFANQGAVSYQWYFNGSAVNGATDYFYVALSSGDYNVVATDENGCEVEAVIFDVIASVQSTVDSRQLTIFPNPVKKEFTIHNSQFTIETANEIVIYNMLGEMVCIAQPEAGSKQPEAIFDVSTLSPGIYYVEISSSKTFRGRFIKQ